METIFPISGIAMPMQRAHEFLTKNSTTNETIYNYETANATDPFDPWLRGQWSYPKTKIGRFDVSFITFEFPLVIVLVILAIVHVIRTSFYPQKFKEKDGIKNLKDQEMYHIKYSKIVTELTGDDGSSNDKKPKGGSFVPEKTFASTGFGRYTTFITHEQIMMYLTVVTFVAIAVFQTLSGNRSSNAGSVILILMVAIFFGAVREVKKTKNIARFVTSVIAFASLHLAYIAYMNSANNTIKTGKNVGRQPLFMVAGGMLVVAMSINALICVTEYNKPSVFRKNKVRPFVDEKNSKKIVDLACSIYAGEYLYYVTDVQAIVITFSVTTFIALESIFIANAATAYYNACFYFLWIIPVFFLIENVYSFAVSAPSYENTMMIKVGILLFNMMTILLGFTVLALAQFHVASIPYRDDDGSWKRQIGAPKYPHKSQIGLKLVYDKTGHLDMHGAHEVEKIVMQTGGLIAMEIFTALLITCLFAGAEFTRLSTLAKTMQFCSAVAKRESAA